MRSAIDCAISSGVRGSSSVGLSGSSSGFLRRAILLTVAAASFAFSGAVLAKTNADFAEPVALSTLPTEARQTHRLIESGGPFPYAKDGIVFGNREQRLPRRPRGFYREYTVPSPQAHDRGARRIVCGGEQPKSPEICYFTADHYASFKRIAQ